MKKIALMGLVLGVYSTSILAYDLADCSGLQGCERRVCEKKNDLAQAQQNHDAIKVHQLQNSLLYIESLCGIPNAVYGNELKQATARYEQALHNALAQYLKLMQNPNMSKQPEAMKRGKYQYDHAIAAANRKFQQDIQDAHKKSEFR